MKIDFIGWVKGWRLDKVFNSFKQYVIDTFTGTENDAPTRAVEYAVKLVQSIKEKVSDPAVQTVVDFIPGDIDDKFRADVIKALELVLSKSVGVSACTSKAGLVAQVNCFVELISQKPEAEKTKALTGLAFDLAVAIFPVFSGGKINFTKLLALVPLVYMQLFKKDL